MPADRIETPPGRGDKEAKPERARTKATERCGTEARHPTPHRVREAERLARSARTNGPPSLQLGFEPHRERGHLALTHHELGSADAEAQG